MNQQWVVQLVRSHYFICQSSNWVFTSSILLTPDVAGSDSCIIDQPDKPVVQAKPWKTVQHISLIFKD